MPEPVGDTGHASATSTTAAPAAPVASPATSGSTSTVATDASALPSERTTSFASALRQAAEDTSGADPTQNAGPVPLDRHKSILESTRKEAADKAVAEYHAKLGWDPSSYKADAIQRYAELDQALATDPVQVAYDIMQRASQDPRWQGKIKSLAARTLAGRPQQAAPTKQAAPDDNEMPGPDVDGGYSPAGLAKLLAWNKAQALAEARTEFQKELDPFRSVAQTFEDQRKSAEREQYLDTRTAQLTEKISKLPLAKEHEAQISEAFFKLPATSEADLVANMFEAYHAVVDPIIEGKSTQSAMAKLATQAQANSARPNNGKAGAVVASAPKRFADALRENVAAASR